MPKIENDKSIWKFLEIFKMTRFVECIWACVQANMICAHMERIRPASCYDKLNCLIRVYMSRCVDQLSQVLG